VRFAELDVRARLAPSDVVVVEGRQIVVNERERVHELESGCGRQQHLRLGAGGLARGETQNRPHALAARVERVPHRVGQTPELGRQRELLEVGLAQLAQLVRAVHPPRPPVSPP
jgi:hypothetical protein